MKFAVFHQPVVTIYDSRQTTRMTEDGLKSTISDEGLYGMVCRVLEEWEGPVDGVKVVSDEMDGPARGHGSWVRVLTHYGYAGWVRSEDLTMWTAGELQSWQQKGREGRLALVDTHCADVMSIPKVQGHCFISLVGGGVVEVLSGAHETHGTRGTACRWAGEVPGWTKVRLLDGREGYMRTQHLCDKRFAEDLLWQDPRPIVDNLAGASARGRTAAGGQEGFALQPVLDRWFGGSEEAFRETLVSEAMKYLGIQYRWGGKSFRGIDCSGLVSVSYMRCGILIYRDASIVDGYPIRRLPLEDAVSGRLKKGDALYFPGHIAMYIGDGKYIHSTGKVGSGGVVINSLRRSDPDFRQDLPDCLYAVGGVRV